MEKYIKIVYFTVGLAVMIFVGSLNALLMTPKSLWFSSLRGMVVYGKAHSVCWLFIYILQAIQIGMTAEKGTMRRSRYLLYAVIGLSIAWCGVFFRLHSMAGAVCLLSASTIFAGSYFAITAKKTSLGGLLTAPIFAWYLYLLTINIYLAVVN